MIATSDCSIIQQIENLGTPIEQDFTHVLARRHPYRYANEPAYWYHPQTKQIILPDGKRQTLEKEVSLTELLDRIEKYTLWRYEGKKRAATLYLVAGRLIKNRPGRDWFTVGQGWQEKRLLWSRLQASYEHSGFTVSLYGTGNFFDEEKDVEKMYAAWDALEKKLENAFNADGYKLLGDTPAQTGRELLQISLPKEKQYPRLPNELLDLITHNFGQARIETFSPQKAVLENGVYVLDGRWMYASCVSHLPTGDVYRDTRNEFLGVYTKAGHLAPIAPGFYNVTVTVPENWHHIGLIKSSQAKTIYDESGYYPNVPGETFTNWTTASELALALEHGWHVRINERILWPFPITDPLAMLRKKLVELREENTANPLLKAAFRSILLHLIGSFHRTMTFDDHVTPLSELPLKTSPYKTGLLTAKGLEWVEARPLSAKRQPFIHPEFSATVWGRARAKLAQFALRLPYEDIVSLRTDSVWSVSKPDWLENEDTGKPGIFRLKERITGPWPWPKNGAAMRAFVVQHNLKQGDMTDGDVIELEKDSEELEG
jgi:hypothetical protein